MSLQNRGVAVGLLDCVSRQAVHAAEWETGIVWGSDLEAEPDPLAAQHPQPPGERSPTDARMQNAVGQQHPSGTGSWLGAAQQPQAGSGGGPTDLDLDDAVQVRAPTSALPNGPSGASNLLSGQGKRISLVDDSKVEPLPAGEHAGDLGPTLWPFATPFNFYCPLQACGRTVHTWFYAARHFFCCTQLPKTAREGLLMPSSYDWKNSHSNSTKQPTTQLSRSLPRCGREVSQIDAVRFLAPSSVRYGGVIQFQAAGSGDNGVDKLAS